MFKARRLVCLGLVCAMAGVAYGAAKKITSFTTYNEPADADGMATLNVADSQGLVVQIIISGFNPNADYVLALYDDESGSEYNAFGAFTTDAHGNGRFHTKVGTLFPWPNVRLYRCVGIENPVCELAAQGNL